MKKYRYIFLGDLHDQLTGDRFTGKGHVARLATVFKQLAEDAEKEGFVPVIVGIGDYIGQGPFSTTKGKAAFNVAEQLGVRCSAIGNSEFNYGVGHLSSLMADHPNIKFLAANLDFTKESTLGKQVQPFAIEVIGEEKIAFIGLTTEEIKKLGSTKTGGIELQKDLQGSLFNAIKDAREEGATTFVVLSHLGLTKDKELAQACVERGLNVVILGGHTHTTLGDQLPAEYFGKAKGFYPEVRRKDGHVALVVNTPHHGQAATYLDVEYDEEGHIMQFSRNSTIVIDEAILFDHPMQGCVESYQRGLPSIMFEQVGEASVPLTGLDGQPPYARDDIEDCIRQEETPLGNLAADALYWKAEQLEQEKDRHVDFAFAHAGGIRTDFGTGPILGQDLYAMHPFEKQNIVVVELTGGLIKEVIEECVAGEDFHRRSEFVIGSEGFSYAYKIYDEEGEKIPRGHRVSEIMLGGFPLEDDKVYRVAINAFLANMNNCDGHPSIFQTVIENYKGNDMFDKFTEYSKTDRDALIDYMRAHKPTLDGRLSETPRITYQGTSCLDKHCPEGIPYQDRYIAALRQLKLASLPQSQEEKQQEETRRLSMTGRR